MYLKLRDRASYEFALASAAVVITIAGGKRGAGTHRTGWAWAPNPWRSPEAEAALAGSGRERSDLPQSGGSGPARCQAAERRTGFKIELARALPSHTP